MSEIQEHLDSLAETIQKTKARYDEEYREYEDLRAAAATAKDRQKATYKYLTDMIEYRNKVDGESRNCNHRLVSGPSGRGVGFDTQCKKCGWFENAFPVY